MDNESTARLKFDTRMVRRRGWVEPEELEQELASLPDVSDKVHQPDEDASSEPGGAPAAGSGGSEGGTTFG